MTSPPPYTTSLPPPLPSSCPRPPAPLHGPHCVPYSTLSSSHTPWFPTPPPIICESLFLLLHPQLTPSHTSPRLQLLAAAFHLHLLHPLSTQPKSHPQPPSLALHSLLTPLLRTLHAPAMLQCPIPPLPCAPFHPDTLPPGPTNPTPCSSLATHAAPHS